MTVQPVSSSVTVTAERAWLASLHGTDSTETITVDLSMLSAKHTAASADPAQPYSRVLSGVPVGRITESGLYGAFDPKAEDGREVFAGVVFADALFSPGAKRCPAALLWHGVVVADRLPGGGLDPAAVSPSVTGPQIRFV